MKASSLVAVSGSGDLSAPKRGAEGTPSTRASSEGQGRGGTGVVLRDVPALPWLSLSLS